MLGERSYVKRNAHVNAVKITPEYLDRHLSMSDTIPAKFDYTIGGKYTLAMLIYPDRVEFDMFCGEPHVAYIGEYLVTNVATGEKQAFSESQFNLLYELQGSPYTHDISSSLTSDVFVMRPSRDPHAIKGLRAYAESVATVDAFLAHDISTWVDSLEPRKPLKEV